MIGAEQLTGVVLAGGFSSRFGSNKAMQCIDGETFLARAIRLLQTLCSEVMISGDRAEYDTMGIKQIKDIYEACGPLGGIHAGLKESTTPYVLFLTCDMPMMSSEPLKKMLEEESAEVVGWRCREEGGGVFPLLVSSAMKIGVEQSLRNGKHSIKHSLYVGSNVRLLDIPDKWIHFFHNVNRKEDLEKIR